MKPTFSFFICLILLLAGASSCNKTSTAPSYSIQGLWIGTYVGNNSNIPPAYFSFVIQPGGTMLVQGVAGTDTVYATGSWTLTGDSLQCNYNYFLPVVSQSATAIYNSTGTLTSGVWKDIYDSGTFQMKRIE
jgi:hypothetical protein